MESVFAERGKSKMAVDKLTNANVKQFCTKPKRYSVRDSEVQGLILRVEPSGKKLYYLDYKSKITGKRSSLKIGDATILTVSQAREVAKTKLADIIRGIPVIVEKKPEEITVEEIFNLYKKEILVHHKSANAINFIARDFSDFFPRALSSLTGEDLTNWRSEGKEKGKKASSLNRASNAFLAMVRWARENDKIANCPLIQKKVKKLPESDSNEIIRFISPDERNRLLTVLDNREQNGEPDYLRTIVLVALNTGIRRSALLNLRWNDITFETRIIRLRRETAKGDKQSFIPMNHVVFKTLFEWKLFRQKKGLGEYLFIGSDLVKGNPIHNLRILWKKVLLNADIQNFRWHDLRHDFASQLVMAGVSILTVMKLMTHSRLDQTLRYAHLAPDQMQEAVKKLESLYC